MAGSATPSRVPGSFTFGRFRAHTVARQLLIDGEPARLGARAFDLLLALIERRDRVVGKNELLELVWPGLVVEENNLQVHISALRKLLGPGAIATIPGRGYRFTLTPDSPAAASGEAPTAEPPPAQAASRPPTNLPTQLAPLIGRDLDVSALAAQVQAHPLVSIVGAGGIGKTRLAQAVAQRLQGHFADGVWLVELAPVVDAALLPAAVAQALGATLSGRKPALEEVIDALRGRTLLIVLDNCEHLVDAASRFAQTLLEHAPGARLLVTSQELLRVTGEQLYRAAPLGVPEGDTLAEASAAHAVALFAARVAALQPGFVLSEHNAADVADICRRLDGLPLAIELAAARVPLLGVAGVRERLHERFRLLTAGARAAPRRHQTLHEMLAWSHGLLGAQERAVFRRAGVFTGSFNLPAAQHALADDALDEWAVLEHLGTLVDKSLLVVQPGEPPRYRLLESARAFALEKLREAGETDTLLRRHAQAMLALFEREDALFFSVPAQLRQQRCLPDIDNLRAALDWAANDADGTELLIALASATARMWHAAGLRLEGLDWCAKALARISQATLPGPAARLRLGWATLASPRVTAAEIDAVQRAVELFRQLGDRRGLYLGLTTLAQRCASMRRFADAQRCIDEAAGLVEPAWPAALKWQMLHARAMGFEFSGRPEAACALWEEMAQEQEALGEREAMMASLSCAADCGFRHDFDAAVRLSRDLVARLRSERFRGAIAGYVFANLSGALAQRGQQLDEALTLAREAVPLLLRHGVLGLWFDHFALLALRLGRAHDAARTLGRAEANGAARGVARDPHEQRSHDAVLKALQQTLPANELERLLKEGAALSDEHAAHIALGE
jgi:predicted ATPase/DNA-binding winged helix-turn-helix (wHTH) protein